MFYFITDSHENPVKLPVDFPLIHGGDWVEKPPTSWFVYGNHDPLPQPYQSDLSAGRLIEGGIFVSGINLLPDGFCGDQTGKRWRDYHAYANLPDYISYEQVCEQNRLYNQAQTELWLNSFLQVAPYAEKLIVVSHIPLLPELCFHRGKPMDFDYLPFFSVNGIKIVATIHEMDKPTLILQGHTHSQAFTQRGKLTFFVGEDNVLYKITKDTLQKKFFGEWMVLEEW